MGSIRDMLLGERKVETEPADSTTSDKGTYWHVMVMTTAGGQYPQRIRWSFGHEETDPHAEEKARTLAQEIIGDGTGFYISKHLDVMIQRAQITTIEIDEYPRR